MIKQDLPDHLLLEDRIINPGILGTLNSSWNCLRTLTGLLARGSVEIYKVYTI